MPPQRKNLPHEAAAAIRNSLIEREAPMQQNCLREREGREAEGEEGRGKGDQLCLDMEPPLCSKTERVRLVYQRFQRSKATLER